MKVERLLHTLLAVATLAPHAAAAASSAAPPPSASASSPPQQPSASSPNIAAATAAFRRGSALAKAHNWEAALAAYEDSARIQSHPLTTYDIGFCERALGRYVRASMHFEEVLSAAQYYSLPPGLVGDATRCLAEVRANIVHVSVVRRPEDLSMTVDGMALEPANLQNRSVYVVGSQTSASNLPSGAIEVVVDPGTHVFVGTGPGAARVVETQSYDPGQQAVVTLALPEQVAPPPPPSPPPLPAPKPEVHDAAAPRPNHTATYVAFGVGAAGLVGAAVFSGLALSEKHTLDTSGECQGNICPPKYTDTESRMTTYADVATVSISIFAAGAVVGTYLWLTASSPTQAASTPIAPWFAAESGGVIGHF
jgi:hypothetical protein